MPAATSSSIRAALDLVEECNGGASIRVSDDAEAQQILAWLRGNYGLYAFEDNPPSAVAGAIALRQPEPGLMRLLGASAFAVRYRGHWPVRNLGG